MAAALALVAPTRPPADRMRLVRMRQRLEAAIAYAIDCLDIVDAELAELEDDEGEIYMEDCA